MIDPETKLAEALVETMHERDEARAEVARLEKWQERSNYFEDQMRKALAEVEQLKSLTLSLMNADGARAEAAEAEVERLTRRLEDELRAHAQDQQALGTLQAEVARLREENERGMLWRKRDEGLRAEVERLRDERDIDRAATNWIASALRAVAQDKEQAEVEQLTRSRDGWEADARRESQNAAFHREKREQAEANLEELRQSHLRIEEANRTLKDKLKAVVGIRKWYGARHPNSELLPLLDTILDAAKEEEVTSAVESARVRELEVQLADALAEVGRLVGIQVQMTFGWDDERKRADKAEARVAQLESFTLSLRESALPDVVPEDVDALKAQFAEARAEVERLQEGREACIREERELRDDHWRRIVAAQEHRLELAEAKLKAVADVAENFASDLEEGPSTRLLGHELRNRLAAAKEKP